MSRVRGTEKAAAAAVRIRGEGVGVRGCADVGHGTFAPFFLVQEPVFRKSSAFDPKTEDLRGTCKKSTNAEPVFPPLFRHFLEGKAP